MGKSFGDKKKIVRVMEYLFLLVVGVFVTTYTMAVSTKGNLLGLLVHLCFKICVVSLAMCITKKKKMPFIIYNVVEYIFSVINYLKIVNRGQAFEPWDLSFVSNAGDILSFISMDIKDVVIIIIGLLYMIAVTVLDVVLAELYLDIPDKKGKIVILCIALPMLVFFLTSYMQIYMNCIELNQKGYANYSPRRRSAEYGTFVNFCLSLGLDMNKNYVDYSEEVIDKLYEGYDTSGFGDTEYDNIIIVLLESYYDMTQFDSLNFTIDPLYNFHKLSDGAKTTMLVDSIGGGTANTEYKALTMHSVDQYYNGIYPYMHLIDGDIESLPRLFKNNGYKTTAIHNYMGTFYNRERAYEYMGIDEFITEKEMGKDSRGDNYISDKEVLKKIQETMEKQDKSFITATTMGGHSPYDMWEFAEYDEWMEDEEWQEHEEQQFNNYFQKLRNTDKLLGELIEYIKGSDEKTLLIAYGDHFPLVYNLALYEGIVDGGDTNLSQEKYPELYKTPCIIYSNVEEIELKDEIITSEIGMYILENVKLNYVTPLYKVIYDYFRGEQTRENYELVQYHNIQGASSN